VSITPLIYVINLDRDRDRLKSISLNLASLGFNFERVPGVIGKEVTDLQSLVNLQAYAWRNRRDDPRAGEVGCYLSHLKAMETFLKTEAPWCVVLEDDVEVLPGCVEVLRGLAEKDDWDLVKLYNNHSGTPVKKRALRAGYRLVVHLTRTTSSAAYIVNRRAAKTLLKSLLPISEQIDHALDRPWETGLRTRGVRPMPVVFAPIAHSTSSIGYQDKAKARRTLAKSVKLFLSRAKKEIARFTFATRDALS
jgi:glycosyl transferase family 25